VSALLQRDVWIKRDDLVTVGVGGNKVRKLEYLSGDALARSADTFVTIGAAQSNHARCVAAGAAMLGLPCHLVLGQVDGGDDGNLLLDRLLGAHIHDVASDDWGDLADTAAALVDDLVRDGAHPYFMPIGGSTPVGALGFVGGYVELRAQLEAEGVEPAAIVHATSSGGTQAGLETARAICGDATAIVGVGVAKTAGDLAAEVNDLVAGTLALLGTEPTSEPQVTVLDGFRGPDYGVATTGSTDALLLALRHEGVLLDPVYTAKAFDAVLAGAIPGDGPIVFWHTGGAPATYSRHYAGPLLGVADQ
jgi:1-aminocyclopropane-1-carboxylate deaminase/D-cysteine desulfhydrase-like pyridoxal-dependent ACC family enzyme